MFKNKDLQEIVILAGEIVKKYFYEDIKVNYKSDKTPVTIADFETNEFLKKNLKELMPSAQWLSEEDKDNTKRLNAEYVWIIDPIDGTQSFIEKIPELSISVALVKNNMPFSGAVYNPIINQGGFSNGFDNEINFIGFENRKPETNLKDSNILVSNSEYKHKRVNNFLEIFPQISPIGSVANKLMRIAGGADDFYYSVHPKSEWDIAGGVALLVATNKRYVRFDNQEMIFNQENTIVDSGSVAGSEILIEEFFKNYSNLAKTVRR